MQKFKVGFVGTGSIAAYHAEVVSTLAGVDLEAVCDISILAARTFAQKWDAPQHFNSIEEMMSNCSLDAIHILTPPDTHAALASKCIENNIIPFIEKPLATSAKDLQLLQTAIAQTNIAVGVNHNAVYYPAFAALREAISNHKIGKVRSIQCHYEAPLRQLESGQFSHWMFCKPNNILLEQAVHPLSQIFSIMGSPKVMTSMKSAPIAIGADMEFYDKWAFTFEGTDCLASLNFAVGNSYPIWKITVVGTDGVIEADIIRNRTTIANHSPWLEAYDHFKDGKSISKQITSQAKFNFINYCKSMIGLKGRSDPFFISMKSSITAFYKSVLNDEKPLCNLEFAQSVVEACLVDVDDSSDPIKTPEPHKLNKADYCVIGGTGFIGRYIIDQLVSDNKTVRVLARNTQNLPSIFSHKNVELVSGDARDHEKLTQAISKCDYVINLAHGGGGQDYSAIMNAMWDSVKSVAEIAKSCDVKRLVHIGSIAGLFLGDRHQTITGETPPDPKADSRADYARAKAHTDSRLQALCENIGLEQVIIRPGIVVGRGTSPFHSGLGVFNNEQNCLGWSKGNHPLPFVLVEDVAKATITACSQKHIAGKSYNLAGDVRPSARAYIEALANRQSRPLHYHAQSPFYIFAIENLKIFIKRLAGKKQAFHSLREFKSRAMFAQLDCSDAKKDLDWQPANQDDLFYGQIT